MKRFDIARYATRVAVRRVVAVLVLALLAWAGIGRADAACTGTGGRSCDTPQEAYAAAAAAMATALSNSPYENRNDEVVHRPANRNFRGEYEYRISSNSSWTFGSTGYYSYSACPSGTVWSESSKTCYSRDNCLALNEQDGFDMTAVRSFVHVKGATNNSYCPSSGCAFVRTGSLGTTCFGVDCVTQGSWNYSGDSCSTVPGEPDELPAPPEGITDPTPPPETCVPISGQSLCKRSNHTKDLCASSSTGRLFCWPSGQTGEKTDGPEMQKNNAGPEAIPPNLSLPSGDTLVKDGPSKTVDTTTTTTNNTTTTTTQTISNYKTQHGTNAGESNQAEGSKGEGGEGDGDGDQGTAEGGGDCTAPPSCSGDSIMCAQLALQWRTACSTHGDSDGDGQPDWTEVEGDGSEDAGEEPDKPHKRIGLGVGLIDQGGFLGAGSCPELGIIDLGKFGEVDLDSMSWMCQFVSIVRTILLFTGAFIAFGIIAGRGGS